jgi:hypothetical protein
MAGMWLALILAFFQMTKQEAETLATDALTRELGASVERIQVRRATPVDWPDASLGCPKPGEMYAQALTPGYLVLVQADEQVYSVHVGNGRAVVCGTGLRPVEGAEVKESFEPEAPIALPEAPKLRELVLQARDDLAKRKTASPDAIELLEIQEVVWPDASLGCPEPGKGYAQVTKEGLLIRLRLQKRVYRYHSGQSGAPFLCENPAPKPR